MKDNGLTVANIVEDHVDWHNVFVGQYNLGDISYKGLISVNNDNGMYWKRGKNFVDQSAYHVRDSIFLTDSGSGFEPW
jgi:hypothetical protein